MARYTGAKTKISRIFGEPILGNGKWLKKNSNPPGQHGANRKRKTMGEFALQLKEKQKAKYTYGVLERQFRKTFHEAARLKGVTGENLIKLLESRLDNVVFRLGLTASRNEARQVVNHKHICVNGIVTNIPSYTCKVGDIITYNSKTINKNTILAKARGKNPKIGWLDWNDNTKSGTYIALPDRDQVPENIKEQLIVELYSK
ncbi:MAG: 30S ribosomal protein S4 [Sediminibacterium sp.]|nr:30S ribosomal protein S4 [Sediminibacterium sp.]